MSGWSKESLEYSHPAVLLHSKSLKRRVKGVGVLVVVEEGIELPRPEGGVCLAVGSEVVSGFIFRTELCLQFGRGTEFSQFAVGISKSLGVPFLAGRLVLLVGLLAVAIELFSITDIEIAGVSFLEFTMDEVDTC